MDANDGPALPGPLFWGGLLVVCVVSWFMTFRVFYPVYGFVMASLFYGDSFAAMVAAVLAGGLLFFLMDLLLPALFAATLVATLRVPEGACYLFQGALGWLLFWLCLLHAGLLVLVLGEVLYVKYVADLGGTWPWLTLAACLWGWSAVLACCRFLIPALSSS